MIEGSRRALLIETPEGIAFSLPLAGPVARCMAYSVDLLCIAAASSALNALLGLLGAISPDAAMALLMFLNFTIATGYGIVAEWLFRGQTMGKRLVRLRVMDRHGLKLRFSQVVLRNVLRAVDLLPAFHLTGGVACLLSPHAQRLGDLAAGTVVVRVPKVRQPDVAQVLAGKYNSLRDHPHLAARLRKQVHPEEARVALQAVLRRDRLDPAGRVALFSRLASLFQERVEFPAEAIEGLPDEGYVRNVVDILFRTR